MSDVKRYVEGLAGMECRGPRYEGDRVYVLASDYDAAIRERDSLRAAVEKHNSDRQREAGLSHDSPYLIPLPPSAAPAASEPNLCDDCKTPNECYGQRMCVFRDCAEAAASEPKYPHCDCTKLCEKCRAADAEAGVSGCAEAGAGPLDWTYDALAFLGRLRDRMDDGDIAAVQDFIGAARASLQQTNTLPEGTK